MASKQFLAALSNQDLTKPVEINVPGTEYLKEGVYNVAISATDINNFDNDRVGFVFSTEDGKTHSEAIFLTDQKSGGLSIQLSRLLTGVFGGDGEANRDFLLVAEDGKSWGLFVGMKLQVTLKKPSKGFEIRATADKTLAVYDRSNNEQFPGSVHETYDECSDFMKANNLKRAYLRITNVKATAKEENVKILRIGLGNLKKPVPIKSI